MIDVTFAAAETAPMEAQSARSVLLVRPACFGFNAEAAQSNVFARQSADSGLQAKAVAEFEGLARRLSDAGVEVLLLGDTAEPPRPDAVFPNNWFTTHGDGTLVLYPMATAPRRLERRPEDVREIAGQHGFEVRRVIDLSGHEAEAQFLEGTGSLLLDRCRHRAFASLGPRTHAEVIADFDDQLGYSTFVFDARDPGGRPIYHTNVLLSLGSGFAVLCPGAVAPEYRRALLRELEETEREIIELTFAQLRSFGCNVLQLQGAKGPVIAMSATALAKLQPEQIRRLEKFGDILTAAIPTIEAVGGGSVRCMIAEIHLPRC